MTYPETENTTSNAKLWATLNLDSATLLSAQIIAPHGEEIYAVWSQRDVIASRKRVFSSTYILSKSNRFIASPPVEIQDPSTPDFHFSPSRKRFLRFTSLAKNGAGEAGDTSTFAEVWTVGAGLDRCWEISPTTHGPVFTDEWFGSVTWSRDETMVAYIADRPRPVPEAENLKDQQEAWIAPLAHKFHESARDPFGEAYGNRRSPALFIADLAEGGSYPAYEDSDGMQDMFFGEPQWSPDGRNIVASMRRATYVDVDEHPSSDEFLPNDLGLLYCYNRYSAIVMFNAPESPEHVRSGSLPMVMVSSEIDAEDFCCNSPRFSPNGKDIIYLSAPRYDSENCKGRVLPHNTTKLLRGVRINENGLSPPCTLIPVPQSPNRDEFPGLYLHSLPEYPWLDSNTLVFTSTWGSVNKVLSATLRRDDGHLTPASGAVGVLDWVFGSASIQKQAEGEEGHAINSITLLDVHENKLLIAASNPVTPTQLFVGELGSPSGAVSELLPVSNPSTRAKKFGDLLRGAHTVDLVAEPSPDNSFSGSAAPFVAGSHNSHSRFQVTVLLPKKRESKAPFIVYPHGGPHVVTLNGYSQGTVALLKLGFAVMYVNYRGSLGLGQESLETLPGNVGSQEINEIVQATRWALRQTEYFLDAERVGFMGGSHSGFIGAHTSLISGLYKRTVLRNPVTNIATMSGASDIPDWCFCEAGLRIKNENGVNLAPDAEQLRIMYQRSPVSRVKPRSDASQRPGPTLLQVGGSDRRVPPQQSLEWKRIMTEAYGTDSLMIRWYPNSGHAIDEVPNGDDAWVHALDFLCKL